MKRAHQQDRRTSATNSQRQVAIDNEKYYGMEQQLYRRIIICRKRKETSKMLRIRRT